MESLPVSLSLTDRKCLVVGTHAAAGQLATALINQQAQVVRIHEQSKSTSQAGVIVHDRPFKTDDLDDCWLVVAAYESNDENNRLKELCDARQIFCNIVSDAGNSSFVTTGEMPATTTRPETGIDTQRHTSGFVSLVGSGPGDPDLLTLRALSLIKSADAIVYDRLVSKPILALCNPNAEFIYAGKAKANHTIPQNSINELLVQLALKHRSVVRLKGGDPFIFGRGGEEIETLADQQIDFQVVPGITAASGCAAFSGIPLTHRDHAQSCIFVTGHLRNGTINLNWQELTDPDQTIVVYMGLTGLDLICQSLIQHGRSANTPAALIEQGTKPEQRVLSSTLESLPELVASNEVAAPTLLIIGGVVTLREKLGWFNP